MWRAETLGGLLTREAIMKILCCPDSFKESLTAAEAAAALADGAHRVLPQAEFREIPMADGGEGFMTSLADALGARKIDVPLSNARGESAVGTIAVAGDRAVIEAAEAVGIGMVPAHRRRIREMTSYGVGQLILAALDDGASEILVGLGGSGTNDGGAGMLRALGARFLDDDGEALSGSPTSLTRISTIDMSGLDARLSSADIRVACDVDNPLLGPRGASAVFGPQKGASSEDVTFLDAALEQFARVAGHLGGPADTPGAGAAGGLGYAMTAFLGASLQSGVDVVMEAVGLEDAMKWADLILTGEGAMDHQTLMGKTLSGVARLAVAHNVPAVGFAGMLGAGVDELYSHGFVGLVPIVSDICTLDEALANGRENLTNAAERAMRLIVARTEIGER